jgi:hypothetical protein
MAAAAEFRGQSPKKPKASPNIDDLPPSHPEDPGGDVLIHDGMSLNEAKTIDAIYKARLTKDEWEKSQGKLIDADQAKLAWFKHITAAKTRIMGIPASCKSRYSDLPLAVVAVIDQVCREALEDLANGNG